jgi:predicted phage tail protein
MIDPDLTKQNSTPQRHAVDLGSLQSAAEVGRAATCLSALRLVEQSEASHRPARKRAWVQAQLAGAVVGLLGGLAGVLGGSLLTAASWFTRAEGARQGLATAGSVLLYLTIPLLLLGAVCMDWVEEKRSYAG